MQLSLENLKKAGKQRIVKINALEAGEENRKTKSINSVASHKLPR